MLRAVERVLSQDHQVVATRLPLDALTIANEFRPELAIVDIRMPEVDGFELMARLKARFPALDVILMTGSVDDLDDKLRARHPQSCVLLHPEAVRSRSAPHAGRALCRTALAT